MAFFSRKRSKPGDSDADQIVESTASGTPAAERADAGAAAPENAAAPSDGATNDDAATPERAAVSTAPAENVPHVPISVSTYGKSTPARPLGVAGGSAGGDVSAVPPAAPDAPRPPTVRRPPAEAPGRTETVPGIIDNALVQQALQALPEKATPTDIMNVMRQAMQGSLYVRAQGDARALLADGKPLNLAISSFEGKRFLLAYTGGAALQAAVKNDGNQQTSALGQTWRNIFTNAAGSYDGVLIDHASAGARTILPTPLIEKALAEGDEAATVKELLTAPRTPETAAQIAEALTRVPLWVGVGTAPGTDRAGIAESRTADGRRYLEIFTHPLELLVLSRGDKPAPVSPAQLGGLLAGDSTLSGLMLNPAGPWIRLERDDLGPLFAAAPAKTED